MKSTSFLNTKGIIFLSCLVILSMVSGCKKKAPKKGFLPDSTVYSSQNYTNLTLDSQEVTSFLKVNPISNNISKEIVEFYTKRNNQLGWFNQSTFVHLLSRRILSAPAGTRESEANLLNCGRGKRRIKRLRSFSLFPKQ